MKPNKARPPTFTPPERSPEHLKSIDNLPPATVRLPAGMTFIPFGQVEFLLADAMAPDAPPLERFTLRTLIGRELVDAVRTGTLPIAHPRTRGPMDPKTPWPGVENSFVAVADFRVYAAARGVDVAVPNGAPSPDQREPAGDGAAPASDVPRFRRQEDAILSAIRQLGYTPAKLPKQKRGLPGVKRQVKEALGDKGMWSGSKVFDHAWDRLRDEGAIMYEP